MMFCMYKKILEETMEHDRDKDTLVRRVRKNFRLPIDVAEWLSSQQNQTKVVTDAIELYRQSISEDKSVRL